MSPYTVVFHMPEWIADGLKAGTFETVGGVIRERWGKQVVMWLRPLADQSAAFASTSYALPQLPAGAALAGVLALPVLLVTVAGFVCLSMQIARVEHSIEAALGALETIRRDTGITKDAVLGTVKAELAGAFLEANISEANGNFDALARPLQKFETGCRFYSESLEKMIVSESQLERAPDFVEHARLYVLAIGAKARALTILRNRSEAARMVAKETLQYGKLREAFLKPLDTPEVGIQSLIDLNDSQEKQLRASLPLLPSIAAAEYMPIHGLGRDQAALDAMREAETSREGDQPGAVVVTVMAPRGWSAETDTEQSAHTRSRPE